MTLYENIKKLRLKHQLSQSELARLVGYSNRTTIAKIEAGKIDIPQSKIAEFAKALHVDPVHLMGLSDNNSTPSSTAINFQPKGVQIPVLGYVIAGVPISATEDILGYEEIPKKLADTGDFFALRIKGASMEPQFFEGDVVIVRQQSDVDDNDIAIVLVNGDEATVKQIKKNDAGITLIGFNVSVYPPHFYSNKDIEDLPVSIIGKVIQVRRDY